MTEGAERIDGPAGTPPGRGPGGSEVAGYSVVADVGQALVARLEGGLEDTFQSKSVDVALASPDIGSTDQPRVTLYLYRVEEHGHLRNAEPEATDHRRVADPPLALDLRYLLTAHSADSDGGSTDETARSREQHRMLGRAMQVLAADGVLAGAAVGGDEAYVTLDTQRPDQAVSVWNTFDNQPYQPSVTYLVGPVAIDPIDDEAVGRVTDRDVEEYVPAGETDG